MQTNICTFLAATLLASACSGTFGDPPSNDTQLGDDDAGDETGIEDDPEQVPDHGMAQYCVDRWAYNAEASGDLIDGVNADIVAIHERWYSPPTRSYDYALDITDKPSPMIVPNMNGAGDPIWGDMWDDPGVSGLVSGYHVALPSLFPPDPGPYQWPYGVDLVTNTIGNPPEAGRHTWMAEPCCASPMTPDEITTWLPLELEAQYQYGNKNGDCAVHASYKGVHDDVAGYIAPYDPLSRVVRTGAASQCVNNHVLYNPAQLAPIKAASLGSWISWHRTKQQLTTPLNLNLEWVASWGLISAGDFAGFGATIDAVVQALLNILYLPPADFDHPRYGGGSGCAYSIALKYSVNQWQARVTCPYGYYAALPDFDQGDLATQIDGVVGHCVIDGVGGLDGDGSGPVVLAPDQGGHAHLYYITDFEAVHDALWRMTADSLNKTIEVDADFAAMLLDEFDIPLLDAGDKIMWWSTAGVDGRTLPDALAATLGYDVEDLVVATGWTQEEAERWSDSAPPIAVSELVPGISGLIGERRGNDLRSRNTFALRAEHAGVTMMLHLRAE